MLYRQAKPQSDLPGLDGDLSYWRRLLIELIRRKPQSDPPGLADLDALDLGRLWLVEHVRRELPVFGEMVANDLKAYYFPSVQQTRKRRGKVTFRQALALYYEHEIKRIAAEQNIFEYDAKPQVVDKYRLQSVEALEQFIKRGKRGSKD